MPFYTLLLGIAFFYPQTVSDVSGKIVDSDTKLPLPYCNIVNLADPVIGTISNVQGDFILNDLSLTDSLEISQIGYHSIRVSVSAIPDTIYLKPQIYELEAATALSLDFESFIPKVKESIDGLFVENYPVIEGVFRKQVVENQEYVFMGECSVAVRNLKRFSNDSRVSVLKSAITVNEANLAGHGLKIKQTLNSNLLLYPSFYIFDEPISDNMRWKIEDVRLVDNGKSEVYVLSYEFINNGRNKERGLVYIRAEDYGILRIDREMTMADQTVRGLEMKTNKIIATYQYQSSPETGKLLLHYSRLEWCFFIFGEGVKNEYTMTTDFLVTNIDSTRKNIRGRTDIDPFELFKDSPIVDKSDLRVIPPDYE